MNKFTIPEPPATYPNPFLLCKTCQVRVTNVAHPGKRNVPCGHRGYEDVCPTWNQADGCTCTVPHRDPAAVPEPVCPLSELPPKQCACKNHRGGNAPGEEPIETVGQAIEARYATRSECCERGIREGDSIARVADGSGYVHAGRCPR